MCLSNRGADMSFGNSLLENEEGEGLEETFRWGQTLETSLWLRIQGRKRGEESRWQQRRLLNFSSHGRTKCAVTGRKKFPLREIQTS